MKDFTIDDDFECMYYDCTGSFSQTLVIRSLFHK